MAMPKYTGRIKSYNAQKGWGFIECAETEQIYGKDIFVMKKTLPDGYANKGDLVEFDVQQGSGGPEAVGLTLLEEVNGVNGAYQGAYSAYPPPVQRPFPDPQPPRLPPACRIPLAGPAPPALPNAGPNAGPPPAAQAQNSGRGNTGFLGYVKSYNPTKGWGFVTSETLQQMYGKDIFFMKNSLRTATISTGDCVRFTMSEGAKGPQATDIQLVPPTSPGSLNRGSYSPGPYARPMPDPGPGPGAFGPDRRRPGPAPGVGGHWMAPPGPPPPAPAVGPPMLGGVPGQVLYGTVKGYSAEKGWGHIDCAAASQFYGKDVFLMRSALEEQSVQQGTLVSFRVVMTQKGPHAAEVKVLPEGSFGVGGSQGSFYEGTVKSFNPEKGWGFITSEEITQSFGKDIFLHRLELRGQQPEPGDSVHFTVEPGKTGQLEAKQVSLSRESPGYRAVTRPSVAPNWRQGPY